MQTILGATGQIGQGIATALRDDFTSEIRLVSRKPKPMPDIENTLAVDLLDSQQASLAVAGSEVVYFAVGLPLNTAMWVEQFPIMLRNVLDACEQHQAKLVFFDNTYMYPQTNQLLTEDVVFAPNGPKGQVRAHMANMVLQAMQEERVEALIARAPEFYGPDKTQGFTNFMVLNACRKGKQARVFMRADTLRTLIFTPDASRATALLGNTADAFGQTWHLPCDDNRMTYAQLIAAAESLLGHPCDYRVLRHWQLILLSLYKPALRETKELWPRYAVDNLFDSSKFKSHFPEFSVTSYIDGLRSVLLKVHIN